MLPACRRHNETSDSLLIGPSRAELLPFLLSFQTGSSVFTVQLKVFSLLLTQTLHPSILLPPPSANSFSLFLSSLRVFLYFLPSDLFLLTLSLSLSPQLSMTAPFFSFLVLFLFSSSASLSLSCPPLWTLLCQSVMSSGHSPLSPQGQQREMEKINLSVSN